MDRKGTPTADTNIPLQLAIFSKMTHVDQKIIALNVVGGFQTNSIKNKWDKDREATCEFCDEIDSRPHRLLHCPTTSSIRESHPEACSILAANEKWQYLPFALKHDSTKQFHEFLKAIHVPPVERYTEESFSHHRYFTHGACLNPAVADARISSWAVIRDMSQDTTHALALTQLALEREVMCPSLHVVMMGITEGRQTISRGELTAVILAAESAQLDRGMEHTDIITDSQYVINVVRFLEAHNIHKWGHLIANFDLVQRLDLVWNSDVFQIHKIKSHQALDSTDDLMTKRWIMGNAVADKVASRAIQRCPREMLEMAQTIQKFQQDQAKSLCAVFHYLVELNNEKVKMNNQHVQKEKSNALTEQQRQFMAHDALDVLKNYTCTDTTQMCFDDCNKILLKGNLQGYNLGLYILSWARTLEWPPEDLSTLPEPNAMVAGWGISWFELYLNFVLVTRQRCPVRISGTMAETIFAGFHSDKVKILPADRRSGMVQCTAFQAAVRCVESILQIRIVPPFVKKGGTSLHRFGFQGQISGLSVRPVVKLQHQTTSEVYNYVSCQTNKRKLRTVVPDFEVDPLITLQPQCEPSPKDRFLEYKRMYGRRRYS